MKEFPALRGAALALLAAVLFGLSAPLIRRFGVATGPWSTAVLLYAGAACAGLLWRSGAAQAGSQLRGCQGWGWGNGSQVGVHGS